MRAKSVLSRILVTTLVLAVPRGTTAEDARPPHLEAGADPSKPEKKPDTSGTFTVPLPLDKAQKLAQRLRELRIDGEPAKRLAATLEKTEKSADKVTPKEFRQLVDVIGEVLPQKLSVEQQAELKKLFADLDKDVPGAAGAAFANALRQVAPEQAAQQPPPGTPGAPQPQVAPTFPPLNPFEGAAFSRQAQPATDPALAKAFETQTSQLDALVKAMTLQTQAALANANNGKANARAESKASGLDKLIAAFAKNEFGKGGRGERGEDDGPRGRPSDFFNKGGPPAGSGNEGRKNDRDRDRDRDRNRDRDRDRDRRNSKADSKNQAAPTPPPAPDKAASEDKNSKKGGEPSGEASERSAKKPPEPPPEKKANTDLDSFTPTSAKKDLDPDESATLSANDAPAKNDKFNKADSEALDLVPGGGGSGGSSFPGTDSDAPGTGSSPFGGGGGGTTGGGGSGGGGGEVFGGNANDYGGGGGSGERFNFEKAVQYLAAGGDSSSDPAGPIDGGGAGAYADPTAATRIAKSKDSGMPLFLAQGTDGPKRWILDNVGRFLVETCAVPANKGTVGICLNSAVVAAPKRGRRSVSGLDPFEDLVPKGGSGSSPLDPARAGATAL